MVKPISTNEMLCFQASLWQRQQERGNKKKKKGRKRERRILIPPISSVQPHRSIFQHELQGGVAIFVVLNELGGLPHLVCIGDPHSSTLRKKRKRIIRLKTDIYTVIGPRVFALYDNKYSIHMKSASLFLNSKQPGVKEHQSKILFD